MDFQETQECGGDRAMKIHIIGCSGSGKSYLARKLSEKYCIPHFDLDDLPWDNHAEHYGVKMPPEKRSAMLQEIVQKENWIIEGVYYKWVQDSFRAADMIYVLEIPSRVYKFRILRRFFKRKLGLEKGKKETLHSVLGLIRWTDEFQSVNMPKIQEMLKPYGQKVQYLRSKRDINNLL